MSIFNFGPTNLSFSFLNYTSLFIATLSVEFKPEVRIELRRFPQVTLIAPTVLEQTGGQSDEYF